MIETQRLEIIPLNARQLRLWAEDTLSLEKELQCGYKGEPLECFFLTELDGLASQRLRKRCGFVLTSTGETLWWKI